MMIDTLAGPEIGPARFFMEMWHLAQARTATQRAAAPSPSADFRRTLDQALAQDDAEDCIRRLRAAVDLSDLGHILDAMKAMDQAFAPIHPRTPILAPGARRPALPTWLRDLRDLRPNLGFYWQEGQWRLIPRGPLLRAPRQEWAANTDCLADHFTFLSVVPVACHENHRPIRITSIVKGTDAATGVPLGPHPGAETIALLPVAEDADDLDLSNRAMGDRSFVRVRCRTAASVATALATLGPVDIALAPELVMTEDDADTLAATLDRHPSTTSLILAGSGDTRQTDGGGFAWNEARVLNGSGATLWRQRKIQIAGMTDLAQQLDLLAPGTTIAFEDNAAGDEIVVADLDGLGRCIVLICQDVLVEDMASLLVRDYQPDWVFVPLLDKDVDPGRWTHQRAFSLSGEAHTRFLIVSSTTLGRKIKPTGMIRCGLAIGPKTKASPDEGRRTQSVSAKGKPGRAILQWRNGPWKVTSLAVKKPH